MFYLKNKKQKLIIKKKINIKRSNAKGKLSDSLNNALFDKNRHEFWKVCKINFGINECKVKCVEGMLGDARIAEKFADFFGPTCSMNPDNNEKVQRDRTLKQERFAGYSGLQRGYESVVNLDYIQTIIDELALGKAASYDMISAEQ